jgi:hypothetical protein
LLGFKEEPFFEADASSREVPTVGDANTLRRQQNPPQTAPQAPAAPANAPAAPPATNSNAN